MKLLLCDGSNILLRCAFGGDVPPEASTPAAIRMIERTARELGATHLVVALDYTDAPSWRKLEFPEYKAHRTVNTSDWLIQGAVEMSKRGWHVAMSPGFEADDVIATIAARSPAPAKVTVFSNDSDMLALTATGLRVARPEKGGVQLFTAAEVCEKYSLRTAAAMVDYKAMCGESGDNVPGVPGIGPKRASSLLAKFDDLESIITAGEGGYDKYSSLVAQHADVARRAKRLVTLRADVPIDPIAPAKCALLRGAA